MHGHWLKDYIGPRASAGGGEIDLGYSCTETTTLLTDESVTTVQGDFGNIASLSYSTPIDADTIKVTFDGTEYVCNKIVGERSYGYGGMGERGPDFSEYPFAIIPYFDEGFNRIFTETAGTYQVKIEAISLSVMTTPCFEKAVEAVSGGGCKETVTLLLHNDTFLEPSSEHTEVSNENSLTVNANSTASFTVSMATGGGTPIESFDSGNDNLVITSISLVPSTGIGIGTTYTVKLKNISDSNVTLPAGACKIWLARYKEADVQRYTLCGSEQSGGGGAES